MSKQVSKGFNSMKKTWRRGFDTIYESYPHQPFSFFSNRNIESQMSPMSFHSCVVIGYYADLMMTPHVTLECPKELSLRSHKVSGPHNTLRVVDFIVNLPSNFVLPPKSFLYLFVIGLLYLIINTDEFPLSVVSHNLIVYLYLLLCIFYV